MFKFPLLLVQLAGILLSGFLILITFADPAQVEQRVKDFAIAKVEESTNIAWEDTEAAKLGGLRAEKLGPLADFLGEKADNLYANRRPLIRAVMKEVLWDKCREGCSFYDSVELVDAVVVGHATQLRISGRTTGEYILDRYESSVSGLISDLRRFGFVNIVVLSLMMLLVLLRDHLNWRFFAFSAALTGYTAWAAYGYIYQQNWALSILFQNWSAPAYQFSMVLVSLVLLDWLFLNGKITKSFLNSIKNIFLT